MDGVDQFGRLPPTTSIQNLSKSPSLLRSRAISQSIAANTLTECDEEEVPNTKVAQKMQINLSNDMGMKCSQI